MLPRIMASADDGDCHSLPSPATHYPGYAMDGLDASTISLVVRGDKLPLRHAISSCYNSVSQQLVVVSATALFLYGRLLEIGGELLGVVAAEENVQFQLAFAIPWLGAYGVIVANVSGGIEHRVVSAANFSLSHATHSIAGRGVIYSAVVNASRHEVITADSDGGFKVWVLRPVGGTGGPGGVMLTTLKGYQRLHAGSRKCRYQYLLITGDDRTILASTSTRIHAFDSTTCARIGTFYRSGSVPITSVSLNRVTNCVYIQVEDARRQVQRMQGYFSRGRMYALELAGVCSTDDEILAFASIEEQFGTSVNEPRQQCDGLITLDPCGNVSVGSCCGVEQPHRSRQSIGLQIVPTSEKYLEIHAETGLNGARKFVLVVCSTGIYTIEIFLPGLVSPTRRVITNVAGTSMYSLRAEDWRRIAIFNASPRSLLFLQHGKLQGFFATLLQIPLDPQQTREMGSRDGLNDSVFAMCAIREGLIIVWSGGDITRFDFSTERRTGIGRGDGSPSAAITTTLADLSSPQVLLVGNDRGRVSVWLMLHGGEVHLLCTKDIHKQRILSLAMIDQATASNFRHTLGIASAAVDGEIKVWHLSFAADLSACWDLLVCFRTYASSLSATAMMGQEYLFCGSTDGGFECWRLPILPTAQAVEGETRRGRVAVLKRALHSIDLHLTRICQVIVEPGEPAKRLAAAHLHEDEFAWVITYDKDSTVLIWCFSTTFLFPHRKLQPHGALVSGFLDANEDGVFKFYAYVGRCLDCFDELRDEDRVFVRNRLSKARELSDASLQRRSHLNHVPVQYGTYTGSYMAASTGVGGLPAASSTPVRLRITLPTVEQVDAFSEIEAAKQDSPGKNSRESGKKELPEISLHVAVTDIPKEIPMDVSDKLCSQGRGIPPVLSAQIRSKAKESLRNDERKMRCAESRRSGSRPVSTYAPESLPSQFQQARPRTYRRNSRPITSEKERRCNIVTSALSSASYPSEAYETFSHSSDRRQSAQSRRDAVRGQDRATVVTITDADLVGQLRLDFRVSAAEQTPLIRRNNASVNEAGKEKYARPCYLEWSSMGSEHQQLELMAACRSRCIVQDALADRISVPAATDFSSSEVKTQLEVRAFSRWYLASQHSQQRVREGFLREELRFAVQDAYVNVEMKRAGCAVPASDTIGVETSEEWIDFTAWYATGNSQLELVFDSDGCEALARRLCDRQSFLERRLQALQTSQHSATGHFAQPDEIAYIFDVLPRLQASAKAPSAWTSLTIASQEKELALALLDPMTQMAAIADDVQLPDLWIARLEGCGILALAGEFLAWWVDPSNVHRQEGLNQELKEAAADESVLRILTSDPRGEADQEQSFVLSYFASSLARVVHLERRLQRARSQQCVTDVTRYGKQPTPLLFESLLQPLTIPFRFPTPPSMKVQETGQQETSGGVFESSAGEEPQLASTIEGACIDGGGDEGDAFRRQELELILMAEEDVLSRELNGAYESASDDDQDDNNTPIDPPKRTDFTNSYFFGNLPKQFRVNSGGWLAGSGIDNGDEEVEEEERLEKERNHQEMLDRLEAERIAEVERQAERLRLEKERDDKSLQMRRLRQLELKKILVHQAELELQREKENEHECMLCERAIMAAEEEVMRNWLTHLDAERAAMEAEDKAAAALAQAKRDARKTEMRRLLNELTLMNAEDRRSALVQEEQLEIERQRLHRIQSLTELYEPFEPFYAASSTPSVDMLPQILKRPKRSPKERKPAYALPFAEALTMDEVEQEHYAARDSRKLRQLMGLPVTTPQSRRMMRIPSEREIIKTRHDLQIMLPPVDDHCEEDRVDHTDADFSRSLPLHPRLLHSNQTDRRQSRLPELEKWKPPFSSERLTNLAAAARYPDATHSPCETSTQRTIHSSLKSRQRAGAESPKRQQTALPFFRGNFIVEGRSRSQAYAPK